MVGFITELIVLKIPGREGKYQDFNSKLVYKGLFKIVVCQSPEKVIFQEENNKISPEQGRNIFEKIDFLCIFTKHGKRKE